MAREIPHRIAIMSSALHQMRRMPISRRPTGHIVVVSVKRRLDGIPPGAHHNSTVDLDDIYLDYPSIPTVCGLIRAEQSSFPNTDGFDLAPPPRRGALSDLEIPLFLVLDDGSPRACT
jgi:hypothetical protein